VDDWRLELKPRSITKVRVGHKNWNVLAMSNEKRNRWALAQTTTNTMIEKQNLTVLSSVTYAGNISAKRKYIFKLPCRLVTNPPEIFKKFTTKLNSKIVLLKNLSYYHTQTHPRPSPHVVDNTEKDRWGYSRQTSSCYSEVHDLDVFDRILYDWVKDLVVYLTTKDNINFRWELSVGDLNKNDMVTVAHTEYRNSFEIDHPNKMKFSRKVRTERYGWFLYYTRAAPEDQQDTVHVHAVGSNFATMEDDDIVNPMLDANNQRIAERQEILRLEVEERDGKCRRLRKEEERLKKTQTERKEREREAQAEREDKERKERERQEKLRSPQHEMHGGDSCDDTSQSWWDTRR